MLNQIHDIHEPVCITKNIESWAVFQYPESYENGNAIEILKALSHGESDIRNGKVKSQDQVFKEIEISLKDKLK